MSFDYNSCGDGVNFEQLKYLFSVVLAAGVVNFAPFGFLMVHECLNTASPIFLRELMLHLCTFLTDYSPNISHKILFLVGQSKL